MPSRASRPGSARPTLVLPRVYSVLSGELPPLAREQAALLMCGKGAFLRHRSGA